MNETLMSASDVARRLGCSTEWVRQLVIDGKLAAQRTVSGMRIYRADEVERLAQERARIAEEKQAVKAA